mgnify:CR=1 FL=1
MASTQLTKTFASDSNRKTWTWSAWIKRSGLGGTQTLMTQVDGWNGNGNAGFYIIGDQLTSYNFTSSLNAGTSSYNRPSRYLRDVNGWYHIVVRLDTTQSTASDRCRWYVNGEQLTDFAYANYPSLNQDCNFNGGDPHGIGSHTVGAGSNFFDGIMSHVHFADGQSLEPTVFGEYDANGVWKINTSPSFTLGTHGFTILKDGNTVTDQSGNTNNFTVGGGTLTNTEDSPSNVFATMNPLGSGAVTFSNGNNIVTKSGAGWLNAIASLGASSGKYYAEAKAISIGGVTYGSYIGFINLDVSNKANLTSDIGDSPIGSTGISSGGGYIYYNGSQFAGPTTATTNNDIVNLAMDLDNGRLYWGINGTYVNSGVPTSGATGTGGMPIANITAGGTYTFAVSLREGANYSWNFGNGYFGTTAVASAGTNASGNGIFEYDVPTGYTALSTKGLNL